ncbi:MAG TPA: hypothetical protein VNL37_07450, partial [Candidatus Polarisedimenticolia bacterium]|nr:hypothetical protein [Candidatus Polarisedimenticolia bacterium]
MTRLTWNVQRSLTSVVIMMVVVAAGIQGATALTYTSGDVLYVAYQSPGGANYIVDLGPRAQFLNAAATFSLPDVRAADLNGVIGASAPSLFVGLFGVLNVTTRDGIVTANGPNNDFDLTNSSITGAASQIDSFGSGVQQFALAVPSGDPNAGSFASSGSVGSYQSTLDANPLNPGKIADNLQWSVETELSNAAGVRNASPVKISFYTAVFNVFTGAMSRSVIGFFTLNPDGTLSYSPDADGDLIADEVDLCPGVASSDNTDV